MATTFSELIDSIVSELKRPDLLTACTSWLNQSIREAHSRPNSNAVIYYDENRVEEQLAVTSDNPVLWPIPSVTRFQDMESLFSKDIGIYLPKKNPRVALREATDPFSRYYWYRTGAQLAISGVMSGDTLLLSYFMYPAMLTYIAPANRTIQFDPDSDSYVQKSDGTPATEAQLATQTNWLLQRWDDTMGEGLRAKAYKRLGDDSRTRMAYSSYQSGLTTIWQSEPSSNGLE